MESLIRTVNKLQDVFATLGVGNPIDLPQITVIGSSGKSSVLENIVGRDFLPRGSGIVTRRPLVLQLINRPVTEGEAEEWGEFLHKPGVKFTDFEKIREEIVSDTDLKTGGTKGVSPIPINLRVFSPNVLTLTLVDLPGLTKVPVGDQPKDIERQIRDMILKFITKPNAIILAVTAANTDLANSDGLKLAREVDPDGLRTIGVLTKVDLMDPGTDVVDILAGRVIPLRLGYVPVVNRGQKDIDSKKTISHALEHEKQFFEGHPAYSSKAQYCGTPFLARKLNMILMHHIRNTLPEIKAKISATLLKYQQELATLGDAITEDSPNNILLGIITEFCTEYQNLLQGNTADLATNELNGGARIAFVFHEIFAQAVAVMDPFDQIKEVDIRTLLYNSSGSSPALFVATSAFELLEDPSLKCVSMIFEELVRMLNQVLGKPIFKRFPELKEKFYSSVIGLYRKGLDPTNKLVSQLVAAESCYINTGHPDFINGNKAMAIINEKLGLIKSEPNVHSSGSNLKTSVPTVNPVSSIQEETSFFGSFFSKKPTRKPGVLEQPPQVLKATGSISERELIEIEVIKLLLTSYYNIVKRTIIDMVPKATMLNLVYYSRDELQKQLLADLYNTEKVMELLKESDETIERRKECKKMIEALQKAEEIVSTI
ncbi:hypothetical protein ROZALSC1DRAFT_29493 [Rozella allomycis CSF55]|uniref:Vacuolar protein sorting-associated protein 1 n=1 Tax=Rozella allomycis (strain CSF55) TaxID=988480 RepID=A0A4P9YK63_ROZAC|nr:hypothetical protein ROZALSC1DRAFT_29493 [Rozella allomycis CSF55]